MNTKPGTATSAKSTRETAQSKNLVICRSFTFAGAKGSERVTWMLDGSLVVGAVLGLLVEDGSCFIYNIFVNIKG